MEIMFSHVVLSLVVAITGLFAGWWLHSRLANLRRPMGDGEQSLVRELMSSLHRLSTRMAADVDEHTTRVGEVDRELATQGLKRSAPVDALVARLMKANEDVQAKLSVTEGKLDELSQKLECHASEARTDILTGLSNRRAFGEEAARKLAEFQQSERPYSLVIIDIDHFKSVNDQHGHPFGDEILRGVSQIFLENFRGRDIVTRYGGEEFAVLMPGATLSDARRGAEAVRAIIERTRFQAGATSVKLTICLGVAEIRPAEGTPSLIERADQAMYAAKSAGRNCVYWHDGSVPHPVELPITEPTDGARSMRSTPVPPAANAATEPVAPSVASSPAPEQDARPAIAVSQDDGGSDLDVLSAANIDMETFNNMGNKTMFCQAVRRRIAEWNRGGSTFSAILLSVDRHDDLIRAHGASTVKMVVGAIAQAVRGGIRDMDIVARYNDLTFGIVLPDANLRNAICIGERLRKVIQRTAVDVENQSIQFTVSLGIVEISEGDEMATLVERARSELHRAANCGGNRSGFTARALVAS